MRMKKCMLIGLICLLSSQWMWGQHFPQMDARNYVSDTALFIPRRPWLAASEVFGMNMAVWTFDRFLMNEDFAKINGHTIKQNFKTGPVRTRISSLPTWWPIPITDRYISTRPVAMD